MSQPKKLYREAQAAAQAIRSRVSEHGWDPNLLKQGSAVQLGSGLRDIFEQALGERCLIIPFEDIPHMMPKNAQAAPDHNMHVMVGPLEGNAEHLVLVFCGRYHLYQGLSPEDCTFFVRVVRTLGIDVLGLTCAAGILDHHHIDVGDVVMIEDVFNFSGTSPLRGETSEMWGDPFATMQTQLPTWIVNTAREIATQQLGWSKLHAGVYLQDRAQLRGYQTPFASKLFQSWGASLVGKSTAIELEVVDDVGISKNFALALATNYANGIRPDLQPEVTSNHVVSEGRRNAEKCGTLLVALLHALHVKG